MNKKAVIFGIKGTILTKDEKDLIKSGKPWGIILFSRNIKNTDQLRDLILSIRDIVKDKQYPIMIDQEGGRVSRLNKLIDLSIFSQSYFAKLYQQDKNFFIYSYKIYTDVVCGIFKNVGINIITSPVLDVRRNKSHNIIGDRSFSTNPDTVSKIGQFCIDLYTKNKIATVIKHMPGHGSANCDSHYDLPIIKLKKKN